MSSAPPTPSERTGSAPAPLGVGLLGVCALAAVVAAGLVGGAFTGLVGFDDGGPLARWGVPVTKVLHDAFAAATVGLLLLAGTIVPERASTHRRATAARAATVTGGVWALAGLAHLVLLVSNVTGLALTDPAYLGQLASAYRIEFFAVPLVSLLVAVAATVMAAFARTRAALTWAAVVALLGVVVLALVGHAAGAAAHDTAVNSLAIHLAGAITWSGGLVALVVLRRALGPALAVSVRRYSTLAAWCFGAVALSGVLNAAVRLGSPAGLATPYGVLVVAKALILLALGLAGWRMRSRLVGRLEEGDRERSAFAGLALGEIALMGAAMGIGAALASSPPPVPQTESPDVATSLTGYPAPPVPLEGAAWLTVRVDWLWLAVAVLGIGLYLAGVRRLRRRGDAWPVQRTIFWCAGWLLFAWVTSGAPGVYGRVMFSAHMLMHMTLTMGVPLVLVLGAPITLASRTLAPRKDKTLGPREILLAVAHSRWVNFFANPVVAAVNFVGSLYVFYFSGLFELALRTHTGHVLMVVHFMLAGYVFAWCLIGVDPGPKRWPPSLRLVLLFLAMSVHAFFGLALVQSKTLLAEPFFGALRLPYVPDLLADQVRGGLFTWGIGELPMLGLAMAVALVWMRADEAEARRGDRRADRDDDAELAAYNAELARRAEATRRAEGR
ncbi:bifunctional copper resistance protein CopD/cytochrome c oxidase assembly protein [Agilicoccus flavus]|uniref:bifunctional copper resistance protein CopD/cytochrome c oxidase assembly protein n=1 Tax=Agilicoccus flavus TaxID=2775968 RepID=UPI001CF6F5CB|nr:bifunctional copper resistance protein CopD/cytochrome c oxidase assembly protein [Agilicoccus flavus]